MFRSAAVRWRSSTRAVNDEEPHPSHRRSMTAAMRLGQRKLFWRGSVIEASAPPDRRRYAPEPAGAGFGGDLPPDRPLGASDARVGVQMDTDGARRLICSSPSYLNTGLSEHTSSTGCKGQFSSGVVEGFNGKARVITKRAYGFRTSTALEVALYHALGDLPEPQLTHRFC